MAEYRDETENLRARVAELEAQLSASEQEVARLRGEEAATGAGGAGQVDALVGEALHFVDERELPFEVTDAGYEAIAALLRQRRPGQVGQVGRTLEGGGLSLTSGDGHTRVRLETDLRYRRRAVLSLPTLAALLGGLPIVGLLLDLAHHTSVSPWNAAWAIPLLAGAVAVGARRNVAEHARTARTEHAALFEAVVSLAEKHRVTHAERTRVRVAEVGEEGADEDARARTGRRREA